jgi:predicted PurR-regulated permease PerM
MLMAIVLAVIPIGCWVIWIPVGADLLIKGKVNEGIGLLLFGFIIVTYIDNLIRPYLVGKKAKMNQVVILLGMLGGASVFGLVGFIVGPIILDYLIIFFELYRTGHLKDILRK